MRASSEKSQRGAIALEFALVVPSFLLVLAIMLSLGRGFWSEFLMLNIASATTRTCVQTQNTKSGTDSSSSVIACAQTTGNAFIGSYTNLCPGGQVSVDTPTTTVVTAANIAGSTSQVRFLEYTIRCDMPLLIYASSFAKIPLYARSTAPFLN